MSARPKLLADWERSLLLTSTSPLRLALLALAGFALALVGSFAMARALAGDSVLGSVRALGIEVGGLSPDELATALDDAESVLQGRESLFQIRGAATTLLPPQVNLTVDLEIMAAEALQIGRQGGLSEQFRWWIGHFGDTETVPTIATIDDAAVEQVLAVWDEDFVGNPPFPGAITFDATTPVAEYPRDGEQVDRSVAGSIILDTLTSESVDPVELPVMAVSATLTAGDVDDAVARARLWLSAPVTLRSEEVSITFSTEQMASALLTKSTGDRLALSFDPEVIAPILEAQRGGLEQAPVNARFEIEGGEIRIVPGRTGTLIDPEATAGALETGAASATRTAILPLIEGAEPEVTTETLEAYGVQHMVSQFTTYFDCCQNRVTNIHLIAEAVDGVIVPPGATFSLNDHVGPRTVDKGYLEDGTIVGGELTKTVGGGVSQFATTLFNAVFWGGYEDVTHKAHSFYFPRYPEGIEATISWPSPDLAFRNDSDAAVLVDTSYTDTSLTVRFFGDNDGRSVALAYSDGGGLSREVLAEGGSEARIVTAEVSDRFAVREPQEPRYRANPDLGVDSQVTVQGSASGWTITVVRTITVGGAEDVSEWNVVYSPRQQIIEVHPCKVPDTEVECPQPSTTVTEPPATTVPSTPDTTEATTPPTTTGGDGDGDGDGGGDGGEVEGEG